ncbi:hypothetical protein [Pseudomonas sp. 34 E 7]|nr:hypothetical protein [Pseudomonas sp. 34 E 7]
MTTVIVAAEKTMMKSITITTTASATLNRTSNTASTEDFLTW